MRAATSSVKCTCTSILYPLHNPPLLLYTLDAAALKEVLFKVIQLLSFPSQSKKQPSVLLSLRRVSRQSSCHANQTSFSYSSRSPAFPVLLPPVFFSVSPSLFHVSPLAFSPNGGIEGGKCAPVGRSSKGRKRDFTSAIRSAPKYWVAREILGREKGERTRERKEKREKRESGGSFACTARGMKVRREGCGGSVGGYKGRR